MVSLNLIGYLAAGFVVGWLSSTLFEWIWFRRRRLPVGVDSGREYPPRNPAAGVGRPRPEEVAPEYQPYRSAPEFTRGQDEADWNRPDDLTEIRGIGEVYEQRLYRAGIFTWHQLASADAESLGQVTRALPNSDPASWVAQARELAREHDRIGATYNGPIPDDLTRIDGIDGLYEGELYRHGIYTYAQLSATTPERLARIIPAHEVGDAIDFSDWIEQARDLADAALE